MSRKTKVAVLFGGRSPEYGVSLQSAYAVLSHMDRAKYDPIMVGIAQDGKWFHFTGDIQKIAGDTWHNPLDCAPAAIVPGHSALILPDGGDALPIDAAFPILHGRNGEDGTVQGILALAGIPVAGCETLSSALCMDKDRAHRLVQAAGIAAPRSFTLRRGQALNRAWAESLGYPLFVKPVRAGSSYGISKVTTPGQLDDAVTLAFSYDSQILLEEAIPGFEVGCAVMGNDTLTVGEVDEIELADGFFDFTEKYTLKTSAIHVPARIPAETARRVQETARAIYRTLDCQGFARVDMFLEPGGRIVFNEVNTIPGFTAHSRFPNMMRAAGLSFENVISTIIELAVNP